MNSRDFGMFFQEFRDTKSRLALSRQAHAESFDAAHEEKRHLRIHATAETRDQVTNACDVFQVARNDAAQKIGMAGKTFGDAVDHEIESKGDGILEDGRCESIVDDTDEMMFARKGSGFTEINKEESRIRRRFHIETSTARRDQLLYSFQGGFDMPGGNAETGEDIAHQAIGTAVHLGSGNQFVAVAEKTEKRAGDGGHARGSDNGVFGTFERGYFFRGHDQGGIPIPCVHEGLALAFRPQFQFLGGSKRKSGGTDDGGAHGGADTVAGRFAGMNSASLRTMLRAGAPFHKGDYWLKEGLRQPPNWRQKKFAEGLLLQDFCGICIEL